MLLSFGITYLFFYNGRQNINLVMTQMAQELGSTTAALGVVSSALFWCYAFGQLINGRLGAFFGYKRFMMFGILASAVINVLISFQSSVPVIAVLWGLNGFFQSKNALLSTFLFLDQFVWLGRTGIVEVRNKHFHFVSILYT
jgi:sugar phosphate permease